MAVRTDFTKRVKNEISERALRLNRDTVVVDAHNHMMFEGTSRNLQGAKKN